MSQYSRQIAVGAIIAIVSAFGLGLGLNLFLPTEAASSTTSSATTPTMTTTATSLSSATFSTASSTSTITASTTSSPTQTSTATSTATSSSSSTTVSPTFAPNPSVKLDSALRVNLVQSSLLGSNATQIAQQLALLLGEGPLTPDGVAQQTTLSTATVVYNYKTSSGSHVAITFIENRFYQLDYQSLVQNAKSSGAFSPLNASASALKILAGMGLPSATDRLAIQIEVFSQQRYVLQWGAEYAGVPIEGTLATNPDGSFFIQGNSVYFEFSPQSGQPTRIVLISPYWYTVGDGFPLAVSSLQAAHIAASYAQGLGMSTISQPQVSFVVVHDSLYYVVTVGNDVQAFNIIVNPRTGEVGLPS